MDRFSSGLDEGILFFPNGDVNEGELEKLLDIAHHLGMKDDELIDCTERVRVNESPSYETIVRKKKIGNLKKIYSKFRGEYDPNHPTNNESIFAFVYNSRDGTCGVYDMGS